MRGRLRFFLEACISPFLLLSLVLFVSQPVKVRSMDAIDAEIEPQLAERLRSAPPQLPQDDVPHFASQQGPIRFVCSITRPRFLYCPPVAIHLLVERDRAREMK
eukprot:1941911-Rhodomonas_salina.3